MSLTIGSGTFTNGSNIVSNVTFSSGGPSFISSGTVITVGTDPLIFHGEAIEATLSSVNLRNEWDLDTGTYTFVATYTTENLRDAVNAAKGFATKLEQANGLISALGSIYDSTADGLLNTASGDYFSVAGSGDVFITLYKNDDGTAEEFEQVASKERVDLAITKGDEAAISAANALQSADDAAATYTAFTFDYTQFNSDFASFGTDYNQFTTDFSTFSINFTTFSTNYSDFDNDYSQFAIDFGVFSTGYAQFVNDFSSFTTDFSSFNADYSQFVADFTVFGANYALFDINYTKFDIDYNYFVSVELPLALGYKNDAEDARDISLANANFAGQWSVQSGAKSPPYSVRHEPFGEADQVWMLNNPIADIALSEPSIENSDWFSIGVIGTTAPDSAALGGETAAEWQYKIDNLQEQVDTNRVFSLAGL